MKLYKYQEEYLAKLPPNCIMAADTGTGKTVMALAHIKNASLPILILAPASKVRTGDWELECKEFGMARRDITVMSYEKATRKTRFASYAKGKQATWWEQWVIDNPDYILIADEIHKAKNPQSLTGRGVYMLARQATQFIGLSATPLPNGWVDLCNYGKIFGWWKNKTEFFRDYVVTYQIPNQHWSKITGYKQIEKMESLWLEIAKPLRKEQALDLPRLRYQGVKTDKPKIYSAVAKTRVYRAEPLDNAPKLANALRRTLIAERVRWIADFLEGASGHTVIFYNYIEERDSILDAMPKDIVVYRQDGERHEVPSKPDWSRLPPRTVTLSHYKSGGTGIEMTYADKVVYASPTYSYADFAQSIGRLYRAGQSLPVTAYLLYTEDTIDEEIWQCVREKRAFDVELWAKKEV